MDLEKNNTRYLNRFRAWDRDTGELYIWTVFDDYPLNGKNGTCPQEFTGLLDKNKEEIYLGDIVDYCGENFLVKFLEGSFIFYKLENVSTLKFHRIHDLVRHQKDIEVIGNTFKHADYLLECFNKLNL